MTLKNKIRIAEKMMTTPWLIDGGHLEIIKSKMDLYKKDPNAFIRNLWGKGVAQGILKEKEIPAANIQGDEKLKPSGDFFADLFGVKAEPVLEFKKNTAIIKVIGPLCDVHSCATIIEGFTSYEDIAAAIDEIEATEDIEKVIFKFDSPGGMVSGCDGLSQKIKGMEIETEAEINDMAASAAYWLASQCDTISAKTRTAFVGSIGVVIEFWDGSRAMEEAGFDKVQLVSDGAPDKRPDLKTSEGQRKIISRLNDIHNIFVERVATGRGVSEIFVSEKFGKGDVLIAEKAIAVNMIDNISVDGENKPNTSKKNNSVEENVDLKSFLESNPGAKVEHDAAVKSASDAAVDKALSAAETKRKENAEQNIKVATKAVISEDYPNAVKELAIKVAAGEESKTSLETTMAIVDQGKQKDKSDAAADETKEAPETPAQPEGETSDNGSINSAEDAMAAVEAMKN